MLDSRLLLNRGRELELMLMWVLGYRLALGCSLALDSSPALTLLVLSVFLLREESLDSKIKLQDTDKTCSHR